MFCGKGIILFDFGLEVRKQSSQNIRKKNKKYFLGWIFTITFTTNLVCEYLLGTFFKHFGSNIGWLLTCRKFENWKFHVRIAKNW